MDTHDYQGNIFPEIFARQLYKMIILLMNISRNYIHSWENN